MSIHDIELTVPYLAFAQAMADLTPEEFVEVIKDVDKRMGNWGLILGLHTWVNQQHRQWALEEAQDAARSARLCIQSSEYPELWGHASPHLGCVLR